ncbi:MAG: C25 family cysteine peptidase [Planctomycetaceae bacterium]
MRLIALPLLCACFAGAAAAQEVLVFAPDAWRPALKEWIANREASGLEVAVRAPQGDLRAAVKRIHREGGGALKFILLVGDAETVPCGRRRGEVLAAHERDPEIASDNHLADLDGDELPDLAVGRLPADSREEAAAMLRRSLAHEASRDFGAWRSRFNVIAGVGGFGALQDRALETVTRKFLTENVPPGVRLSVTWASVSSPFCPPPEEFAAETLERFNEGALLVAYLGHGHSLALDRVRAGDRTYPIFGADRVGGLDARRGAPLAVLIACSTGQFDAARDCLAEEMLRRPAGPIAIVASSRVSMPYANGVFAKELLDALYSGSHRTAGEWFLAAKRRLVEGAPGDAGREQIEMLAKTLYQPDDSLRRKERVEHLFLYNLLGDPTLALALPGEASLTCAAEIARGARLEITGSSPVREGEALLELVAPRGRVPAPRRGDAREEWRRAYREANRWEIASVRVVVAEGRFAAVLTVPENIEPGAYAVRCLVEGRDGTALAGREIRAR